MNDAHEFVLSRAPFVVRRKARWSDCDPAGIVYTGRYTEYLLDSARLYANHLAGGDMMNLMRSHGLTTPARGMSLEFMRPMAPGDIADIRYCVGSVRDHSFELRCEASGATGDLVFAGSCTLICINLADKSKAPIPGDLREMLMRHIKQGDK
jgi:acyl-CoA thioesterase FadM